MCIIVQDSETASTLMQTLVDLARKGRTVVCTIHQVLNRLVQNTSIIIMTTAQLGHHQQV